MEASAVWASPFTNETELECRRAVSDGNLCFGREKNNKQIRAGDNMLLSNKDRKQIFGIAKVSGKCAEPLLIDARNVYQNTKYNKFEIPASKVFLFPRPLSYAEFYDILQIPQGGKTNLFEYSHLMTNVRFTVWGVEPELTTEIMSRFTIWTSTYV
jgi:hypothetical protein